MNMPLDIQKRLESYGKIISKLFSIIEDVSELNDSKQKYEISCLPDPFELSPFPDEELQYGSIYYRNVEIKRVLDNACAGAIFEIIKSTLDDIQRTNKDNESSNKPFNDIFKELPFLVLSLKNGEMISLYEYISTARNYHIHYNEFNNIETFKKLAQVCEEFADMKNSMKIGKNKKGNEYLIGSFKRLKTYTFLKKLGWKNANDIYEDLKKHQIYFCK